MLTTGPISPRSSSLNLLEEKYNQKNPIVTWLSPQENDTFGSWDTLTAKWNSREVLDSPAFRLCTLLDVSLQAPFLSCHNETEEAYLNDNCGSKISPSVEEYDGSFLINFIVPDIAGDAFFVLRMNDASGAVLSSPIFKLIAHPVHIGVRTRLSPQPNFTATSGQPSLVVEFTILLIFVCMLLMAPLLLWICRRHGKNVKMYFRRLRVSQTSTPALLQKIDPGDGTSVPIPVFMPTQTFRAPSQSMRELFLPKSLARASGVHQPLHAGSWRSFRLPNRYSGGSIYPSLPPIPTSPNTFIDEGNTVMANSTLTNYISGLPLSPPGLVSTPPRVHLRPSG